MTADNETRTNRERHHVISPDGPDFRFYGECLADRQSASGGRIRVFKTESGCYVLEQIRSAYRGREPLYRVLVAEDLDKLAEVLTDTQGGKDVMAELGRPYVIDL